VAWRCSDYGTGLVINSLKLKSGHAAAGNH